MSAVNRTILLLEDDPAHRAVLNTWLKQDGYQVKSFDNGLAARRFLESQWVDLAIFDWDLPEISGDRLLRWVRGRTHAPLPIIFQTVRGEDQDIAEILNAGADDYLVKPFAKAVLLARIKALLRRYTTVPGGRRSLEVGGIVLEQIGHVLRVGEQVHHLGVKEFDIAWLLASRVGNNVVRQELLGEVWGIDAQIETRCVDMYVSRLRAKLRELGIAQWNIQSVYGVGYRMDLVAAEEPPPPSPASSARGKGRADGKKPA